MLETKYPELDVNERIIHRNLNRLVLARHDVQDAWNLVFHDVFFLDLLTAHDWAILKHNIEKHIKKMVGEKKFSRSVFLGRNQS